MSHTTYGSYPNPRDPTYKCTDGQPGTQSCDLTLSSWFDSGAESRAGSHLLLPWYVHVLAVGTCAHGAAGLTVVESASFSLDPYCHADPLHLNLHSYTQVSPVRVPSIVDFAAPGPPGMAAWSRWREEGSLK